MTFAVNWVLKANYLLIYLSIYLSIYPPIHPSIDLSVCLSWVLIFSLSLYLSGKTLQKIDIPAKQITSVSWGGRNLDELYVTSARLFSDEEFRNQPLAGSLFKVTGLGARGTPAYVYEG